MRRTPLYDAHVRAGGRIVDFAGWEMPVQYTGILDEHQAVRESVGVFDISHMGEFLVEGAEAAAALDRLLTNNVGKLSIGEGQYTLMLNEQGGVIDDLIIYRKEENTYFLVVNASMIDADASWLQSHLPASVQFSNQSDHFAALAVQGPQSPAIFEQLFGQALPDRNTILELAGGQIIGVTGYTGEAGFEWFMPAAEAESCWNRLLALGVKPSGLGARDTLRLEMCYPLNGSDLSPERTPIEAGLGFFVDLSKPDFIGKAVLARQKTDGPAVKLTAIEVREKSPPIRSHYRVLLDGEPVGETCSGALSPSLGYGIALAYLPTAQAKIGQTVAIEVRGRAFNGVISKKPFYRKK